MPEKAPETAPEAPPASPAETKPAAAGKVQKEVDETKNAIQRAVKEPASSEAPPRTKSEAHNGYPAWAQNKKRTRKFEGKNVWKFGVTAAFVANPITTIAAYTGYKTYDLLRRAPVLSTIDSGVKNFVKNDVVLPAANTALAVGDAVSTPIANTLRTLIVRPTIGIMRWAKDTVSDFTTVIKQKVGIKDPEGNFVGLPGLAAYGVKRALVNSLAAPFKLLGYAGNFIGKHPGKSAIIAGVLYGAATAIPGGIPAFLGIVVNSMASIIQGLAAQFGLGGAATAVTAPGAAPAGAGAWSWLHW